MLTVYDDFQFHQLPGPFSHVVSSDPRWFDKTFYAAYSAKDKVMLTTGTVVHTNADIMDAYVCVRVGDKQHNIRCSRRLRPRFGETIVGPIRQEVVTGMRTIRLVLEPNAHGISFDILWEGDGPAHEEEIHYARQNGRVMSDYTRYDQVGRCSGTLTVAGETFALTPDHWWGSRDHSWGIRPGMAPDPVGVTPPPPVAPERRRSFSGWNCLNLGDHAAFFMVGENPEGKPVSFDGTIVFPWGDERTPIRLVGWEHNYKLIPGTTRLTSAEFTLIDEHGKRWDYQAKGNGLVLSCQGQGDFNGWHDGRSWGVYRGDSHEEYDLWDMSEATKITSVSNPSFIPQVYYLENIMEIRCGKSQGYSLQEVGVFSPYPKYGFTGQPGRSQ